MRVVWAPRAFARAAEIAQYIAADRPAAAEAWVQQLFVRAATLKQHPARGHKVPEVDRDEIRQILYGEYRIIYRLDPKRVVMLTVRHSRQEWDATDVVAADS